MNMRLAAGCRCECGENPLWHPDEARLYWTDIPAGRLYRLDPRTGAIEHWDTGAALGGFTIQEDSSLLLFMARGAVRRRHAGRMSTVIEELPDETGSRFNDVIADPEGRVFCGTMPAGQRPGNLYRLDTDASIHHLLDGIGCSNGLGFTPDLSALYYTDSRAGTIWLFDYDRATGAIDNRRVFVETPEGQGVPDGLTIDCDGCLWSARYGGGCIVRYDPDGREIERIPIPTPRVTSLIFGGDALDVLYVTTAGGASDAPAEAGALFAFEPGVRGHAEFRSRVVIPHTETA